MAEYKFYAFLNRLKYIGRWSLMRNTRPENVAEHSHQTALVAHALCVIAKTIYNENVSADKAAAISLYHEAAEVITGDLPTPIKYYNEQIRTAYKNIEQSAEAQILSNLPYNLKEALSCYVQPVKTEPEYKYVKYADKITALIKCIEENSVGNTEFKKAQESITQDIKNLKNNAVDYFVDNFISAFYLSLDELTK